MSTSDHPDDAHQRADKDTTRTGDAVTSSSHGGANNLPTPSYQLDAGQITGGTDMPASDHPDGARGHADMGPSATHGNTDLTGVPTVSGNNLPTPSYELDVGQTTGGSNMPASDHPTDEREPDGEDNTTIRLHPDDRAVLEQISATLTRIADAAERAHPAPTGRAKRPPRVVR